MKKNILKIAAAGILFLSSISPLVSQTKTKAEEQKKFTVINVTPQGELPASVKYPAIQIQFSEPVIALAELGKPSTVSDIVEITPKLNGTFRWKGTSILSFDSSDEAIAQKVYTININKNTKSKEGSSISGNLSYEFHTEELKISSIRPAYEETEKGTYINKSSVPLQAARDIGIFFNAPVSCDVVKNYITVKDERGNILTFSAAQKDKNCIRILLSDTPPEDTSIYVTLNKGAIAEKDCYPTSQDRTESFHTLVKFTAQSIYVDSSSTAENNGFPVYITFSSPLKQNSEEEIASFISTDISSQTIVKDNLSVSGQTLTISHLNVKHDQNYAITIAKKLKDIYGRELDKSCTYSVTVPSVQSYALFQNSGFKAMESSDSPNITFYHQNIKSGSEYTVKPLVKADGTPAENISKNFVLAPNTIEQDKLIKEVIDLKPFLEQIETASGKKFRGAVQFHASIKYKQPYEIKPADFKNEQILQVTDLGMSVRYSYNKAIVLITDLCTGKPVSNANVKTYILNDRQSDKAYLIQHPEEGALISTSSTDKDGLAVIDFDSRQTARLDNSGIIYFEAKTKDDRLIYIPNDYYFTPWGTYRIYNENEAFNETDFPKSMVSFIFTDRKLYKPGENVTVSVIDRNLLRDGTYETPQKEEAKYTISINENSWNKSKVYCTNSGILTAAGTANATLTLPQDIKPGNYTIVFKRKCGFQESQQTEQINIQFFERLRFEASTSIPQLTYIKGDNINASISANYLGGGSLAGAAYRTFWQAGTGYFQPKNDDFAGMSFTPIDYTYAGNNFENVNGTLDDDGKAVFSHSTEEDTFDSRPMMYSATTQITDSGNQSIQTSASVLVHPAKFYIGIGKDKSDKGFAKKGESSSFVYTVITPDEAKPIKNVLPKDNKLKMELIYEEWTRIQEINSRGVVSYRYERKFTTEETRELDIPSSTNPVSFKITPNNGGAYKIRLSAEDCDGNSVISEKSFYSISSDWYYRGNNGEQVILTPDKDEYHIGDKAQLLMQTELPKGKYLVCVERDSIKSAKIIDVNAPTSVIEIPIEESYVPVVYVSVSTYSDRVSNSEQTPKSYFGVTTLNISTQSRTFDIEINADQKNYQPGDKVQLNLRAVKDAKPVQDAHLFIQVTDRSILDLINYHVSDPVEFFYAKHRFDNQVYGGDSRSLLVMKEQETELYKELRKEKALYATKTAAEYNSAQGFSYVLDDAYILEEKESSEEEAEDLKIRKNFAATAFYSADIVTDKKGTAKVSFTLPDSLTAYRITVVGVKDNFFGKNEQEINAVQPVSARAVLPRKLRLDDKGELGLTISNLTSKQTNVEVSLEVYDGLEKAGITNDAGEIQKLPGKAQVLDKDHQNIKVAADKTNALMFYIKAVEPGWITTVFTLKGKDISEKIILPLEIEKPYIFETVTTIGSTEDTAHETVILPSSAEDGHGKLYIQLDPTKLGVLKEAVSYVFHYPYGCMEQRSAALLPLVAFGDYIKIFGLESEVIYPKGVAEGEIRTWTNVQLADGGFPYWPGKTESSLYVSMRIAEIAAIAKANNIPTGGIRLQKLSEYLINEADRLLTQDDNSPWNLYTASYAYYGAQLIGGNVQTKTLDKIAENDKSDVDTLAFTALTYLAKDETSKAKNLADKLRSYTRLTARGIDITSKIPNHYWCFFNSESENYALFLQLFTKLNSKDTINQHLVYELLKLQKAGNGYWKSTAATARVLIALNDYIKQNDLENLDFTASTLLSGKELVSTSFKGLSALAKDAEFDFKGDILKKFGKDKELDLEFIKTGTGTLYYTASMSYAIPAAKQTARDEGICVYTEIYDAETGEKIDGDKLATGKIYREKVYLSSTINCEYVAVRVPVPAGCEILNDAFVTTVSAPPVQDDVSEKMPYYYWYYGKNRGLSNKAIYDDEIQYFWNYFPRGSQNIEFVFRANRKGEYQTPCVTASCMYEEELFGRSNGKVWTIE